MPLKKYKSLSPEETQLIGKALGASCAPGSVIAFLGELGAGKTTLIKGLVEAASGTPMAEINSPTFSYLNIYAGPKTVYHFDLYRLKGSQEFYSLGFDEYLHGDGICLIEWSERIADLLSAQTTKVKIEHLSPNERWITIAEGAV